MDLRKWRRSSPRPCNADWPLLGFFELAKVILKNAAPSSVSWESMPNVSILARFNFSGGHTPGRVRTRCHRPSGGSARLGTFRELRSQAVIVAPEMRCA